MQLLQAYPQMETCISYGAGVSEIYLHLPTASFSHLESRQGLHDVKCVLS